MGTRLVAVGCALLVAACGSRTDEDASPSPLCDVSRAAPWVVVAVGDGHQPRARLATTAKLGPTAPNGIGHRCRHRHALAETTIPRSALETVGT